MLIHEDAEFEAAAMTGDFDVIVPVSIYLPKHGGEAEITAYRNVWNICERYETENCTDLLNTETLAKLCDSIAPIVRDMGYDPDRKGSRVVREYRISEADSRISQYAKGAVIIRSAEEIEGLVCPLLHRPEPDELDETDVCAIVVYDGVICACAGVNDYSDDDSYEIFVETAKDFRGNGYGTAAVAALVQYLCNLGCTVAYNCAEENRASSEIAEKLGMTFTGRRYSLICYAGDIVDTTGKSDS